MYKCIKIDNFYILLTLSSEIFSKTFFILLGKILERYLWYFSRKSKITAGDTFNWRLSIYVPKKVLVKKDVICLRIIHEQDLNSRAKPGRSTSMIYLQIMQLILTVNSTLYKNLGRQRMDEAEWYN